MIYTFNRTEVEKLVAVTEAAAKCHVPYTGEGWGRAEDDSPGLQLVGDDGVYLTGNAVGQKKRRNGTRPVAYARECNPETMAFGDWWQAKGDGFGGDDGIEFIPLARAKQWLAKSHGDALEVEINSKYFELGPLL
jgi:hypothetical protein